MSEQKPNEGSLAEEFRRLGENLTKAMRAAWDSPERRRLEGEITSGMVELGRTLREEASKLSSGETGQRVRSGAEEVSGRLREELVSALRAANAHLDEAATRLSQRQTGQGGASQGGSSQSGGAQAGPSQGGSSGGMTGQPAGDVTTPAGDTGHREVHPDDVRAPNPGSGHQEVHPDDVES